jgi:hypothetical protein
MAERKTDPPAPESGRSKRGTGSGRGPSRLDPDQYEIKIRWEKARKVLGVSPTGVKFDFNSALQVGTKYPISLTAPGVSFSSTVEVTRCQLTVEPAGGRFFRVEGRFFPYLE